MQRLVDYELSSSHNCVLKLAALRIGKIPEYRRLHCASYQVPLFHWLILMSLPAASSEVGGSKRIDEMYKGQFYLSAERTPYILKPRPPA